MVIVFLFDFTMAMNTLDDYSYFTFFAAWFMDQHMVSSDECSMSA